MEPKFLQQDGRGEPSIVNIDIPDWRCMNDNYKHWGTKDWTPDNYELLKDESYINSHCEERGQSESFNKDIKLPHVTGPWSKGSWVTGPSDKTNEYALEKPWWHHYSKNPGLYEYQRGLMVENLPMQSDKMYEDSSTYIYDKWYQRKWQKEKPHVLAHVPLIRRGNRYSIIVFIWL